MNATVKAGEIDAAIEDGLEDAFVTVGGEFLDGEAAPTDTLSAVKGLVGAELAREGSPASKALRRAFGKGAAVAPPSPRPRGEGEGEGQRGDSGVRPPHPLPGLLPAGGEKEPVADDVAFPELDRHAEFHRKAAAEYGAWAAQAKRDGRAEIEKIKAARKAMRERHQRELELLKREQAEELAALDLQEAEAKADTDEQVSTKRRLAAAQRAALAVIEGE